MKTITIHQGTGEDRLEMTVHVSQKEFDKLEEIRNINPSIWENRELDLVKAAKEAVAKSKKEGTNTLNGKANWKTLIWVILGIVFMIVVLVFVISKTGKREEIKDSSFSISEITNQSPATDNLRKVYDKLVKLGSKGSYSQFVVYFEESESNRKNVYDKCKQNGYKGSYEQFLEYVGCFFKTYRNPMYGFSYQYDNQNYKLVEKTNKNSHCVMKLQSPTDAMKSILISVWEDVDLTTAYDNDFIDWVKLTDNESGETVISSAVKTKVSWTYALKSELKMNFWGQYYYSAIYRIIHKQRMYMINIYIPINEYNKDKSYADKCVERFKFD